jgi:hypothetical protein
VKKVLRARRTLLVMANEREMEYGLMLELETHLDFSIATARNIPLKKQA